MHLSPSSLDLSRHGDGQGDGAPRAASGPPRRRTAATCTPLASSPSSHRSLPLPLHPDMDRPTTAGTGGRGGCGRPPPPPFPLATVPRRCPPTSLALGAASSLCSVCVHVLQVLQETLAACARGRGGPASTQPPAAVPFSSVDALASDSSGDWQVVVPPATAWATR